MAVPICWMGVRGWQVAVDVCGLRLAVVLILRGSCREPQTADP